MIQADFIREKFKDGHSANEITKMLYDGKRIYRSAVDSAIGGGSKKRRQVNVSINKKMKGKKKMFNKEALQRIQEIFEAISQASTIADLNRIETSFDQKFRFNVAKYPKLAFSLSSKELKPLEEGMTRSEEGVINQSLLKENPLAKVLYGIVWKQGDLAKVKHIVNGVLNAGEEGSGQDDALVFYQFGKHLANRKDEPIIDQHTIRAFALYQNIKALDELITSLRRKETVGKNEKRYIHDYKKWLKSDAIRDELKQKEDHVYFIDRILFGLGKEVKLGKEKDDNG
jgi:hypothetical protein